MHCWSCPGALASHVGVWTSARACGRDSNQGVCENPILTRMKWSAMIESPAKALHNQNPHVEVFSLLCHPSVSLSTMPSPGGTGSPSIQAGTAQEKRGLTPTNSAPGAGSQPKKGSDPIQRDSPPFSRQCTLSERLPRASRLPCKRRQGPSGGTPNPTKRTGTQTLCSRTSIILVQPPTTELRWDTRSHRESDDTIVTPKWTLEGLRRTPGLTARIDRGVEPLRCEQHRKNRGKRSNLKLGLTTGHTRSN